ncbi:MAG: SpoIIE family protein phosphatase [Cytophagales bacterium]|nr:SpoIIE family protein phosphatase [Cytophagales bacterium]
MKESSIFQQLLFKVIAPVIVALVALAVIEIEGTKRLLVSSNNNKNKILAEEIQTILEFQDYALGLIEHSLDARIKETSSILVHDVFQDTEGIENANLDSIRVALGLDPQLVDIYIINNRGTIVNTTFKKDLGLQTFDLFGSNFEKFILQILKNKGFEEDKFSPENNTNRLKKYSYHSTKDGKYIVELGIYSDRADQLINRIEKKINNISEKQENVLSVDLFIGEENPTSFNNKDASIDSTHRSLFDTVLKYRNSIVEEENGVEGYQDTQEKIEEKDGKKLHYQYTYMPRENTTIYKNSVIRIVTDLSQEEEIIKDEVWTFIYVFGLTIIGVLVMVLYVTRTITEPLNRLVDSVVNISRKNLDERAEVKGSREIVKLAEKFNKMLDELQSFYNELEQKVADRTAEILLQKKEIEAQRDAITDSIRYAKRIQNAILPTSTQLTHIIKDHFVLYKPKDIVSGDFYWASEKGGKSVIVGADCTGHGVPGAFMSMIGNTLLNKIVNEHNETSPDVVLNTMREGVISSLKQSGEDRSSKDGMDIVICVIDYDQMKLWFAGANNPLFLIRNGELIVYKGDKQPVGYFREFDKPFTCHEIDLKEGDVFYVCSDGYQDQFGGTRDRKFMVRRMKNLFVDIHQEEMTTQKEILNNTIEEWMVDTKQVDDILIIGTRVE